MAEEWCQKLENLKIKENRLHTLTEIRVSLNKAANLESIVTNRLLECPEIYECFENSDECDVASDILSICMANLSIEQREMPLLLERALMHKRPAVRGLALNTILKEIRHAPNATENISNDLLMHIIGLLQDSETEVGIPALEILTLILPSRIDQQPVHAKLCEMLSGNEVVKCRIYELAVKLSKCDLELHEKIEFLLDNAVHELENNDILLHVNVLEILATLAEHSHGLAFLEKHQVFEVISERVKKFDENPMDRILVPAIMKFFGKIACVQPNKIIKGYPHMIQCLFEAIYSGDPSLLPAAFDTLANLANSVEGKVLLNTLYADGLRKVFEAYSAHLRNLSTELKNRAFNTLEVIFSCTENPSVEIQHMLQRWFAHLEGETGSDMQFLMDYCRNPFPDIKMACLSFIKAVCHYDWGISALKNTAGFVEYLLDRRTEFDKEAKYAKYELIKVLGESVIFDVQTHIMLQTYINEGPYYVEGIVDVATEGNGFQGN